MAARVFSTSFKTSTVEAHAVLAFREEHRLGRPAEALVTVQLADYVDPEEMVGTFGVLDFSAGEEGTPHSFGGVVEAVTIIGSTAVGGNAVHHVRFRVVSQMAVLARSEGCEIHQELDVKEIVTKVLKANGIDPKMQDWRTGSYPKREYCVQYNESALAFVSRLLEEEGIWFRTEYKDDGEHVIFEDDSSNASPIEGEEELPFKQRTGLDNEGDAVYKIAERSRVVSGKYVLRDYDFKRPKLDMTSEAEADADTDLEVYDFPGHYFEPAEGKRLAKNRLEAEQATRKTMTVEADCVRFECGKKFKVTDALHDEINGEYVITSLVHELGYSGGTVATYNTIAGVLPAKVKYRAPRVTPWPVIDGPQTARVVAPKGSQTEEIHTDEHGRSKVKFHWDLGPDQDDKASCWMRVGQLQTSGSMVLPRIGWEVIVEFLEGNPDRPIVTGRLYNGVYMPPYALPEGKTRTSLQTASTPGGGGRNEIRFEDKSGSEEIRLEAQYDQNITSANNKTTNVGNNETRTVKVDCSTSIGADQTVKITKGSQTQIGADQTVSVGGSRKLEVNAVTALNVGGKSGTTIGGKHFEMDGNPLKALLDLAAEKAAEVAKAAAGAALAKIDEAVQAKVDQVMGPINKIQAQMEQIGAGMQAVANGDLGAAAGMAAQAAGLPGADTLFGGGDEAAAPEGGGGEGGEGGEGEGEGEGGITSQLGVDTAVNSAIDRGTAAAANALGAALGLDADGGGGESEANAGGPAGDVDGVDATDRAKGPGHNTNKVTGKQDEKVGTFKITAAVNGINNNISGNMTQTIGAARLEMVLGDRSEEVGGNKTESAIGLVIVSRADETEKVTGSITRMVGGAILEKIGGGHSITATAPATFIGAFHKIEAGTAITLKCGASEVVIDGSGIAMTSPIVTITAGKVSMTKAVSEM